MSPGTILLAPWTAHGAKERGLSSRKVIFSGVVSAGYNFIQYTVVQTLSAACRHSLSSLKSCAQATHAAFAGNFNKAATISLLHGVNVVMH